MLVFYNYFLHFSYRPGIIWYYATLMGFLEVMKIILFIFGGRTACIIDDDVTFDFFEGWIGHISESEIPPIKFMYFLKYETVDLCHVSYLGVSYYHVIPP